MCIERVTKGGEFRHAGSVTDFGECIREPVAFRRVESSVVFRTRTMDGCKQDSLQNYRQKISVDLCWNRM